MEWTCQANQNHNICERREERRGYIQLMEKGEFKQHFIDTGDIKSDTTGFDNERAIDYYRCH